MKITIDTTAKTIKLEEKVPLDELIIYLREINIDFKEYSLITTEKEYIYVSYYAEMGVYIEPLPYSRYDPWQWQITCGANTNLSNK